MERKGLAVAGWLVGLLVPVPAFAAGGGYDTSQIEFVNSVARNSSFSGFGAMLGGLIGEVLIPARLCAAGIAIIWNACHAVIGLGQGFILHFSIFGVWFDDEGMSLGQAQIHVCRSLFHTMLRLGALWIVVRCIVLMASWVEGLVVGAFS